MFSGTQKIVLGFAVLTLMLMPSGVARAADDKPTLLFEDPFEQELAEGWDFVREDSEDWRLREGRLQLRAQPGRVWAGDDAENVLHRRPPESAQSITAATSVAGKATEKFEQGGLIWYVDDANFIKLVREHIGGKWFVVMGSGMANRHQVLSKQQMPAGPVHLRLHVDNLSGEKHQITGYWRVPGKEKWHTAARIEFRAGKKARNKQGRVGLFTQDGPKDTVHWLTFEDFKIFRGGLGSD
jgi:regulation of enolase protein 1 (concanavalin A-like superfamily)